MSSVERARRFLLHMRLPFSVVLAPLFVWGAYVSGGTVGWEFLLGFVAFHVFLYGGTNMFNSYYDRDEGPVGGLEQPPPVDLSLLWGSLALKAAGLALAWPLGSVFVGCYLAFTVYSVVYSHPAVRVKKRPVLSTVTVFFGQGVVGFVAGWAATGAAFRWDSTTVVACAGAALFTVALYPLTQIYQTAEDARRGDRTLACLLGPDGTVRAVALLFVLGTGCVAWTFWANDARLPAVVTLPYAVAFLFGVAWVRRSLETLPPRQVYRRVIRLCYLNAAVFLMLLGALLTRRGA